MCADHLENHLAEVRHFGRFFTRQIGALWEGRWHAPLRLTEARILYVLETCYELANSGSLAVTYLSRTLDLDLGFVSRTLHKTWASGPCEKDSGWSQVHVAPDP